MHANEDPIYFQNRYRIQSTRLQGWDYAGAGSYFVTICTMGRTPWFGEIHHKQMHLSDIGLIIDEEWKQTSALRPYVTLDEYVIMPNHMHGIVTISPSFMTTVENKHNPHHRPEWKPGSLGSIIQQFKRACTYRIRQMGYADFAWQSRFHDRIIRDEPTMIRIRQYIMNNPSEWE